MRSHLRSISIGTFAALCLILMTSLPGQAIWPFGPSNYDECISKEMKGVTSDVAARAIIASCRKRFAAKKAKTTELSGADLLKITGTLSPGYASSYSGKIYNGSPYTITTLFIEVTPRFVFEDGSTLRGSTKIHKVTREIGPYETESIFFDVPEKGTTFEWRIKAASGYH